MSSAILAVRLICIKEARLYRPSSCLLPVHPLCRCHPSPPYAPSALQTAREGEGPGAFAAAGRHML